MANLYKPALITTANLTKQQIEHKTRYEQECNQLAEKLASKTDIEMLKYMCYRYRFWVKWDESHFHLIEEYISLRDHLDTRFEELKANPNLHCDVTFRKEINEIKKSIKLVQEALKISEAVEGIIDEYESVLFEGQNNELDERVNKHKANKVIEFDPLLHALGRA
jgi:hypothetical protein